jgi:hypothetical protein
MDVGNTTTSLGSQENLFEGTNRAERHTLRACTTIESEGDVLVSNGIV